MLNSQKIANELYQHLGRLFYAVAIVDKSIHIKELETLKELVREYWLDLDTLEDEHGTDAGFQIEIIFDWLLEHEKEGESCYREFTDFYRQHTEKFTPLVKKMTLDTAHAIAAAFAKKNKSELILLAKLKLLFG
ncbi:MAG: hypothetical protein AAFO99_10730 [Bacteroidota bacterium]